VISDVTGDAPTHVASGPCAPDPSTFQDALDVLKRYGVKAPIAVRDRLADGAKGGIPETPKPGSKVFRKVENRVIASAQQSLEAAAKFFITHDIHPAILGDSVTGEAREVAKVYGALAREIRQHGMPWEPPVALISGGETTVTVRGKGRGGRNCEFLLALARDWTGRKASTPSPATPTASTAPRTTPEQSWLRTRRSARRGRSSTRPQCSTTTTAMATSARSAISS
jgi:hydroxypyruvate reductase